MRIDYAIAAMQIADLSDSEIKAAGESIHTELKDDFPFIVEKTMNEVSVNIDSNGQANTKVFTLPTYHRVNDDRTETISVAKNQFVYHTVKFTSIDEFVEKAYEAFVRTSRALGVKKFGRVSMRLITNFPIDDTGNSFEGFGATQYLAPTSNVAPVKGPQHFEHRNRTSTVLDDSMENRILVSVLFGGLPLPDDLMDVAVDTFNIPADKNGGFIARIDVDTAWNLTRKLYSMGSGSLKENLSLVGSTVTAIYKEVQGG